MRTLVVGDVHGCSGELDDLLQAAAFRPGSRTEADRLVLVGDLVGKGPDSSGVLERVRRLPALAVRGNHDAYFLRWHRASASERAAMKVKPATLAAMETLTEEDWRTLESLPGWLELPEHGALVVHAGVMPDLRLEQHRPEVLENLRSITPDGRPSFKLDEGVPWASRWRGPELVLFGHDAVRGLQEHPHALGLDTGCVYGGRLTGVWLPERTLVSVPARRAWAPTR